MRNKYVKQPSRIPHVSINANVINDNSLSWQATGLYVYMCSKPDGWIYRRQDFVNTKTNGRDATQKCINELKEHGFIVVVPSKDDYGYSGKSYQFYPDGNPERLKTRSSGDIALPHPTPQSENTKPDLSRVRELQMLDHIQSKATKVHNSTL